MPTTKSSKTTVLVGLLLVGVSIALVRLIFQGPEIRVSGQTTSNGAGLIAIAPGSSIRRELAAGGKDVFGLSVDQNTLLRFSIDKGDLLLSTSLYDPIGNKLLEHVSQDFESVELSFPTPVTGIYRIELQSQDRSDARSYELNLHPLTPVTLLNRKESEARQEVVHAETLRMDWKEASFRRAAEHYDKAALTWTSLSDFANASNAVLKSGDVYFLLSEFQKASKRYENAEAFAAKADDWLARTRALSHQGRLLVHVGNNDRAQDQLTKALHLLEQHEANRTGIAANAYGEVLSNLAEVSYSRGDFLRSKKQLDHALKVFQDDRKGEAKVRLFLGNIAGSTGRTEKASAEITQAWKLYGAANDKVGEALALTILTLKAADKEELNRAIETYRKTIEIFRTAGDRHSEAITLNALGQAYQKLKAYPIAIEEYQNALHLFQQIGALDGASVAAFQLATVYDSNGDQKQALEYYERCFQLTHAAGKVRTEANGRNLLAANYVLRGRYKEAIQLLQPVLEFYRSIGDIRAQTLALNTYGDALFGLQQTAEALDIYHQALKFSEEVGEQGSLITSLYNIARANLTLGRPEAALPFIQRSLKTIEDLRSQIESPDFRASYFAGVQKQYQLCTEILMTLDRLRPGEGFAADAFLVSDKGRARLLFDLISESGLKSSEGPARELLERERELRKLFQAQGQYRWELSLSRGNPDELSEADKDLAQLKAEYQEVQAQLRRQNPRLFSLEQTAPLTLQQFQNQLQDGDTMVLQYGLAHEHSYLWTLTSDSFHSYELASDQSLQHAASEFYELITARQGTDEAKTDYQASIEAAEKALPESATTLSQMLLAPVANELKHKRLVIVAEGALQYVPFAALPVPVAKTGGPAETSRTYLSETNEIVVLPSASTLLAIRGAPKHSTSPRKLVAVIADPVFSSNDERVQSRPRSAAAALAATDKNLNQSVELQSSAVSGKLARLTHASEEADAITAVAPWGTTMVAKGFDASRETVMTSDFSQYQIIHFATHGVLDTKNPELSGMILTSVDREGAKTNGFMALHDIYSLDLAAQVTVLSACQTALGKDIKGEGQVGLTHSFLSAGSRSVVSSLWKVDDRATAVLMADFYEGMLQKGMTPSAALRSAQLKMMHDPQWNAPYYWAAFVLQGEYTNHIAVSRGAWLRLALVLLLLLILIVAALLILQARKRRIPPAQLT